MTEASERAQGTSDESFDRIALDLRNLRESAGEVSYAELVRRITALRLQRGIHTAAAIPARSTVYNAFKTGRARMDTGLLRDIVLALGATTEEADAWVLRCREVRRVAERQAKRETPEAAKPQPLPVPDLMVPTASPLSLGTTGLLMVGCVALNLLGLWVTAVFKLSVYLDMVGTAIASIVLGPWHGVAVGIASSNLGFLTGDPATNPFTLVNIAGALVWGYGVRRFRMGADLGRFVTLDLIVAAVCSAVAVPILLIAFGGYNGHASVGAVLSLQADGLPTLVSLFSTNIVTSIIDKLITGVIVLLAFVLLHRRFRIPVGHMPLVERLSTLRVRPELAGVRSPVLRT